MCSFYRYSKLCYILTPFRETVNLDTLEPQQLAQVKKQLDEELDHLTSSFQQLHGAQTKFKECLRCVNTRSESSKSASLHLRPTTKANETPTLIRKHLRLYRLERSPGAIDQLPLRPRRVNKYRNCAGGCWHWLPCGKGRHSLHRSRLLQRKMHHADEQ